MIITRETTGLHDSFELARFTAAQQDVYDRVVSELQEGQKRSHWMWFIFPQIDGLAHSPMAKRYAIKSLEEAREYLAHPVLGARLRECSEIVLGIEGKTAAAIFGSPDDVKLRSSMTLFASVSEPGSVFALVLDKFFNGNQDPKTLHILATIKNNENNEG